MVAFRFSTRAPRRFFGFSICFLLVIALASFNLGEVLGLVVILAALGGGLVILQMARIQKRAPGPLPENPIPSVTEAMGVNTKNSVFGILIAIVSIFVLDKVMAVAGANGLPVPRIWEMHGDYVVLTWLSIFNLFLFRFLQTLRRRAPATACFLSTTALTVSVIAPALAGLLLPGRRLDAIIASCLAGYAAGFAVLKFSRVREKNS